MVAVAERALQQVPKGKDLYAIGEVPPLGGSLKAATHPLLLRLRAGVVPHRFSSVAVHNELWLG